MSAAAAENVLIIYADDGEQWALYLHSVLGVPLRAGTIRCYNISSVSCRSQDFLRLASYKCKFVIVSCGLLEGLCQLHRFFLARVLCPPHAVVLLLCGVQSAETLLLALPSAQGVLQVSTEQDTHDYIQAATHIIHRAGSQADVGGLAVQTAGLELSLAGHPEVMLLPSRIPCEHPVDVFVLLRNVLTGPDVELEFQVGRAKQKHKAEIWNENILRVKAPEGKAGVVGVALCSGGEVLAVAQLEYYSALSEATVLLKKASDPVEFMRQAFQVSSTEQVDQMLSSSLLQLLPSGGFHGLLLDESHRAETVPELLPTLLHFSAYYDLRGLARVLLQCPGSQQALITQNHNGDTPARLAKKHGHTQLEILLQEALAGAGENGCIYEMMGSAGGDTNRSAGAEGVGVNEDEEDPYALFGCNDEEYDTFSASSKAVTMTNRPPVPTPRSESQRAQDNTPFISQVFQKKSQGEGHQLYSSPSKQVRGRENVSSTYDTFTPCQAPGLEELIRLQERVKNGSLTVDEALERFSDWQRVQKGLDVLQQEKLQELRASLLSNTDDENIYDKINIIHHTPANRGTHGQADVQRKADKR